MKISRRPSTLVASITTLLLWTLGAPAAPPTEYDVNTYSSLCKIGSAWNFEAGGELGLIGRRILSGAGEVSVSELRDEFPGIKLEENRLLALAAYQECMYRYVKRFHAGEGEAVQETASPVAPTVLPDRRREVVFLANQLEDFKVKMASMKDDLPEAYYDKKTAREVTPTEDMRLIDLENYNRYKAFQSPSGLLDFTNISNNDLALLCDTFDLEVKEYASFYRSFRRDLRISPYNIPKEVQRICIAAKRGR